ncbi:DUF2785 domain-containing protein [uncultured Enterococcus sp.]|uniref:DUF2785 domain-containing protein n=1 Tax=uncultured Enterococcus sp. TaxID=167972 RepID=UPI002AA709EC|nr:DUF2785 domain-containing protein [uncultured Enterococcus sp.]
MDEQIFVTKQLESNQPASDELIHLMLQHIGSLSEELRETIYSGWCILLENNRLTNNQKQWLLDEIFARKLLYQGIEQEQTDDTFTRSFTSLLLVQLLDDHYKNNWLEIEMEKQLIAESLNYMEVEKDNRGLVPVKGWAHAFAHGADLLAAVARSRQATETIAQQILSILTRAIFDIDDFLWEEESRMVPAIIVLIKKELLSQDELNHWIQQNNQTVLNQNNRNICWNRFLTSLSWVLRFELLDFELIQESIFHFLHSCYKKRGII